MKIPTLINSSSKINGELIFTTDVRIDGEVFGKVESDKSVIIGAEGFVKGFLRAKDLFIFGRFEGNIIVSGLTILHENASVFGNLYTKAFEVKDGAIITARVVMYDKLEAIDEAQIYLAEEMIKVEPNRKQTPTHAHAKISFDDAIDKVKDDQITFPPVSTNQPPWGQMPGNSGDVLSKIKENHNGLEDLIGNKQNQEDVFAEEDSSISFSPDPLAETEEQAFIDQDEIEDAGKFTLLTSSDELIEHQQYELQETPLAEVGSPSEVEQNNILEFDFEDSYVDNGELVLFPLPKPISIAECLGEPVMEDSPKEKKGKKKLFKPDSNVISQTIRKNKGGYNISGFEELRNLLIPVKYQQLKLKDKKNDQEKSNTNKINDTNNSTISRESEKGELFLNNAIRQLPDDDYLSLFN